MSASDWSVDNEVELAACLSAIAVFLNLLGARKAEFVCDAGRIVVTVENAP